MIITFNGSQYPSQLRYTATHKHFTGYGSTHYEAFLDCFKQFQAIAEHARKLLNNEY